MAGYKDVEEVIQVHPSEQPVATGRRFWARLLGLVAFVLVFAAALAATFGHAFSHGPEGMSGLYDAYQYFGPLAYFMDTVLHGGELPLWNPLTYCGTPFAANPQAALFYPPHLVRGLLNVDPSPFSTQVSMVAMMGLHLLLAAGGVFALARSFGLSRGASMASAFAFAFSAAMIRRVSEYHFVYTLSWLPWIVLLTKRALDGTTWHAKLRPAILVGVLVAMAYLGGFLQIILYLAVAVGVFAVLHRTLVVPAERPAGTAAVPLRWDLFAVILMGGVAALSAAVGLLPAAEFAPFTARQPNSSVSLYTDLQSLSPLQICRSLVVYPGLKATGSGIRGSGVLALLLALCAFAHPKRRTVWTLVLTYLVLVDCSFGPPMPVSRMLGAVLPFANSAHARAYEVALFPLSMLVGFGADGLIQRVRAQGSGVASLVSRLGPALLLVALGSATLIALWSWSVSHRFVTTTPLVIAVPAVGVALAVLALLGRRFAALPIVLAALILGETVAWNFDHVDRLLHSRDVPDSRMTSTGHADMLLDNSRGVDELPNHSLFDLRMVMNGYDPLNIRRVQSVLDSWKRDPLEYHRTVAASEPTALNQRGNLFLKRPFWLARHWSSGPLPPNHQLFESASTVFLDAETLDVPFAPTPRRAVLGHALSGAGETLELSTTEEFLAPFGGGGQADRVLEARLLRALPGRAAGPAGAVHSLLRLDYESSLLRTHIRPHFLDRQTGLTSYGVVTLVRPGSGSLEIPCPDMPRCEVTLQLTAPGEDGTFQFTAATVEADPGDEDAYIAVLERSANHVEAEIGPLDDWRILTLTDAQYPGWHATLDGEETPIFLANDAFKAVAVPPGTHRVRFVFEPASVKRGIVLSLFGLTFAWFAFLGLRQSRSRSA